ncbi:MAG TPA: SDR family oxidoreductase [Hyphomicrobiaceae bacterium]|nr:SDR family oxidoreductase [Hyphomicrobiaceae bacterium]
MDLGIKGKKAIVCAASKGLGKGCAQALAREGVDVTICARGAETLTATARELAATGANVTPVVCDVTTEGGRKALLAACPNPDILINNAGGPPPGDFKDFSLDDWRKAVEGNMLTPISLIHATVYGMIERGFGRIVNITSASIKHPIAALELSNGARLGLTGAVAVLARKAIRNNVTINGILPGPFDTDRLRGTTQKMAEARKVAYAVVDGERKAAVPAGRFGSAEEFGSVVAFLCSAHAGYVTGQNWLIDGGGYPGSL